MGGRCCACRRWPSRDDPLGREPGEPLWPEWEGDAALGAGGPMVGSRVWSALYQQSPRQRPGALFPVGRIDLFEAAPADCACVRAWDLAATAEGDGRDPDWTVGLKLGRESSRPVVVLDVVRLRWRPARGGGDDREDRAVTAEEVPVGLPQDPGQAGKHQVAWLRRAAQDTGWWRRAETGAKLDPGAAGGRTGGGRQSCAAARRLEPRAASTSCAISRTAGTTTRWMRCRVHSADAGGRHGACRCGAVHSCRSCPR